MYKAGDQFKQELGRMPHCTRIICVDSSLIDCSNTITPEKGRKGSGWIFFSAFLKLLPLCKYRFFGDC